MTSIKPLSKFEEKIMLEDMIRSVPDGYVRDILLGVQNEINNAIDSDFGFITLSERFAEITEHRAAIETLTIQKRNLESDIRELTMIEPIELKTAPELKRVICAAFGNYKKHKCYMSAFPESGMNINSYWDGGSRDEYALVDLTTFRRATMPTSTHPYFDVARYGVHGENEHVSVDSRGNITLKHLPENFALVRSGTFCGKPATAHVYFNAANMPKLLEANCA